MKKVMVVELNAYHAEVFPVYPNLIPELWPDEGVTFSYCVHPRAVRPMQGIGTEQFHPLAPARLFKIASQLFFYVPLMRWLLLRHIRREQPDLVIFNTIEPERNYRVFKGLRGIRRMGLVHNPHKLMLEDSTDERMMFVCLHRHIFQHYAKSRNLAAYLIPFFSQFPPLPVHNEKQRILAVQGIVSWKRRDYGLLIRMAQRLKQQGDSHIRFDIIGNSLRKQGPKLRQAVQKAGLEEYFIFHEYLSDEAFFGRIAAADYILPLIGPEQERYLRGKATASYAHAGTYNKPMILHRETAAAWDIPPAACIRYAGDDELVEKLGSLHKQDEELAANFKQFVDTSIAENRASLQRLHHEYPRFFSSRQENT